ncbi:FKBP-type peptidyl-prolyl cis-trans isomerase [Duganella sp. PWIR1]
MLQFIAVAACAAVLTACGGGAKTPTEVIVPQPDYKLTTTAVGSGLTAEAGDTVVYHSVGYLYDSTKTDGKGTKVQSSVDAGAPLSGTVGVGALPGGNLPVATGWDLALLGMQPGGKRIAVLPASLAFGAYALDKTNTNGVIDPAIPVKSPMVVEFTMVNVTKAVTIPSVPPPTVTTITEVAIGTGATATVGKAVTVRYTGWLYDGTRANRKGTQFDSNVGGTALSVTVGTGVVAGFSTGLTGMQVGGKRTVIIPPDQGYGADVKTGIPANSTLVFDIELLTVN